MECRRLLFRAIAPALLLGASACAHREPAVARADVPRVQEGVVTEIGRETMVVRTTDDEPVTLPLDVADQPEVVFEDTTVGTGAIVEGAPVRVFFQGEGQLPIRVDRVEILTGDEGAAVRERAARKGPPPVETDEEEGILAPRQAPAGELSGAGAGP